MDDVKERDLHDAVKNGDVEKVRFLVEQGVYVNATNTEGQTPQDLATQSGNHEICRILEEHCGVAGTNISECSPLHYAVTSEKENIVKIRLENGADVNAAASGGATPLHCAADGSEPSMIRLLVENGADIKSVTNRGRTPLHTAAEYNFNGDNVELLIEYGADINARDMDGWTPLLYAVKGRNSGAVSVLPLGLI